jgi:hypothetical protein
MIFNISFSVTKHALHRPLDIVLLLSQLAVLAILVSYFISACEVSLFNYLHTFSL